MSSDATGPKVKFTFHPTFHVPTLDYSEEFFSRVFGRPSTLLKVMPKSDKPPAPDAPKGYSKFTMISDVLIDCVCPDLHVINGVQAAPSVDEPMLQNIGWYCDDIAATYRALRAAGVPLTNQLGEPAEGDEPPAVSQGGAMKMFFTPPDQVGLRYQFLPFYPMPLDPRTSADWSVPAVADDDPLGIERLSHHVILTDDPARALRLTVDGLGGTVIREGRDDLLEVSGPYVQLADATYHYATPDPGTAAAAALAAKSPADKFYAMSWRVADLDRVARHLEQVGVGLAARTDTTMVTDPATSFAIPWSFTTRSVSE